MNRQDFANTKKKIKTHYWVREANDRQQCMDCNPPYNGPIDFGEMRFRAGDRSGRSNCNKCKGSGYIVKEVYSYKQFKPMSAIRNAEITTWGTACQHCGQSSREYIRKGICSCQTQRCFTCKGRGCRSCNFKGKV